MRELVRGLLALLLAMGMSVVFVGCDADDDEDGAGGAVAGADHGGEHADHGGEHADHGGEDADQGGEAAGAETTGADEVMAMMSMVPQEESELGGLGEGCREPNGAFGYCANTDREDQVCGDNGGMLVTGQCDGGSNIVCCVGYQCGPTSNPSAGVCAPEASCDVAGGASVQSGLCPGGNDIKCCLPSEDLAAEMTAEEAAAGGAEEAAAGGAEEAAAGGAEEAATGGAQ